MQPLPLLAFWKTVVSISCELQELLWYKYENQFFIPCVPAIPALPMLKLLDVLHSWCLPPTPKRKHYFELYIS